MTDTAPHTDTAPQCGDTISIDGAYIVCELDAGHPTDEPHAGDLELDDARRCSIAWEHKPTIVEGAVDAQGCRCTELAPQTLAQPAEWEQADDCPVHPIEPLTYDDALLEIEEPPEAAYRRAADTYADAVEQQAEDAIQLHHSTRADIARHARWHEQQP